MDSSNPSILRAQANLEQAEYQLKNTQYVSPIAGEVADLNFSMGDLVGPGKVLFAIIPNNQYRIDANFKETQLPYIKIGNHVKVTLLMYPGVVFDGVVSSIGKGSLSSFALLPAQNATGNFVQVAERYRVMINLIHPDPRYPLRLGASCKVRIE